MVRPRGELRGAGVGAGVGAERARSGHGASVGAERALRGAGTERDKFPPRRCAVSLTAPNVIITPV